MSKNHLCDSRLYQIKSGPKTFALQVRFSELENGIPTYRIFSGYPTDKKLVSVDGKVITSHETLLNSLEAGADTNERRRQAYEAIKD